MHQKIVQFLLETVRVNYEEIAKDFDETRQRQLWPEIKKYLDIIPQNARVLDAGCGNARVFEYLKNKKIGYWGIDQSRALIQIAKERYEKCFNAHFSVGNILSFQNKFKFKYILSIAVLHHIPSQELRKKFFFNLKNQLEGDGEIFLTVWRLWTRWCYVKLILKFYFLKLFGLNKMDSGDIKFNWGKTKISERYYHAFTFRNLKKEIQTSGFTIKKAFFDKHNYYFILK